MAIAGQIEYKVTVDTSGLKKGLNDAKNEASKFTSTLATWGRTATKAFFGGIAIGAITQQAQSQVSQEAQSKLTQTLNNLQAVSRLCSRSRQIPSWNTQTTLTRQQV